MTTAPTTPRLADDAQRGSHSVQRLVPQPFYDADGITIFCGDNRQILPMLDDADLLCTDPPYGIGADNRKRILSRGKLAAPKDYGESNWDSQPPEEWLMQLALAKTRHQIIWGGNYFGLPAIGIEANETYCKTAVARLAQGVLRLGNR